MKKLVEGDFEKFGVLIMAVALIATIVMLPAMAHADCRQEARNDTGHTVSINNSQQELHDALKLSETQETAWKDYLDKSKPVSMHFEFDRAKLSSMKTPERLDRMLSIMKMRQANMESHVQAVKLFYAQLTPEQQKIFDASFRANRGHHEKL